MHVILRGIDRAAVFLDDEERTFFLETLAAVAAEESVAVHAYVLMTNHIHLLMTAARDNGVVAVMKRLGQRYVQHVNRTYQRTGGLFEGRFVLGSPRFERQVAAMVGRRTWKGSPGRPRKETDVGEQGTLGL